MSRYPWEWPASCSSAATKRPSWVSAPKTRGIALKDGAPVTAVGIQGHWSLSNLPCEELDKAIDDYKALGLKVCITELDIGLVGQGGGQLGPPGGQLGAATYGYNRLTFSLGGPTPVWNRLRYFLSTEYFKTDDDRACRYKVRAPRGEYALEGKLTVQAPKEFALTREGLKLTVDGYHSNYQWQTFSNSYKYFQQALYANRVRSYKANVTINNLLPGPFDTERLRSNFEFNARRAGKSYEELRRARMEANPAGRFGTVEEFGDACAFLCSAQAGFITGQNLLLDGGAYPGTL